MKRKTQITGKYRLEKMTVEDKVWVALVAGLVLLLAYSVTVSEAAGSPDAGGEDLVVDVDQDAGAGGGWQDYGYTGRYTGGPWVDWYMVGTLRYRGECEGWNQQGPCDLQIWDGLNGPDPVADCELRDGEWSGEFNFYHYGVGWVDRLECAHVDVGTVAVGCGSLYPCVNVDSQEFLGDVRELNGSGYCLQNCACVSTSC